MSGDEACAADVGVVEEGLGVGGVQCELVQAGEGAAADGEGEGGGQVGRDLFRLLRCEGVRRGCVSCVSLWTETGGGETKKVGGDSRWEPRAYKMRLT